MPEDVAITSSKSDVDPCSRGRETDRRKSADGQTAFQLYIVRIMPESLVFSYTKIFFLVSLLFVAMKD